MKQMWINPNRGAPSSTVGSRSFSTPDGVCYSDNSATANRYSWRGDVELEGMFYLEFKNVNSVADMMFGLISTEFDTPNDDSYPSRESDPSFMDKMMLFYNDEIHTHYTNWFNIPQAVNGASTMMVACNSATGETWIGKDGVWFNDPVSEPATLTLVAGLKWTTWARNEGYLLNQFTMPMELSDYSYSAPTGFTPALPKSNAVIVFDKSTDELNYIVVSQNGIIKRNTGSSTLSWIKGNRGFTGKVYLEIESYNNFTFAGICANTYSMLGGNVPFGNNTGEVGKMVMAYFNNSTIWTADDGTYDNYPSTLAYSTLSPDTLMIAIDTNTGEVWTGKNGLWRSNPDTDPADYTVQSGLEWTIAVRCRSTQRVGQVKTRSEDFLHSIPIGFASASSNIVISGNIIDAQGAAITGLLRSYSATSGELIQQVDSDAAGNYSIHIPNDNGYITCFADSNYLTEGTSPDDLTNITFDYGAGGVTPPPPTFTAIISGNVKKLGVPYGAQVVVISNTATPEVVGHTVSDGVTGDYSVDVAPYSGECNIAVVPDYGINFPSSQALTTGVIVHPSTYNGYVYEVTTAGTVAALEPIWSTTEDGETVSGTVTFTTRLLLRPLMNGYIKPVVTPI